MKKLTAFQVEILQWIKKGSPDEAEPGSIDFDQLLDCLSWKPTKAAAHFSIRALAKRQLIAKEGVLVKRRGRSRVCFKLMPQGEVYLDPRPPLESPKVAIPGLDFDLDEKSSMTHFPSLQPELPDFGEEEIVES